MRPAGASARLTGLLLGTLGLAVIGGKAVAVEPTPFAVAPAGALSCAGCHPAKASAETLVPSLQGRPVAEIVAAMDAFRSGARPATVMNRIAKGFADDEIRAVAAWLEAQR